MRVTAGEARGRNLKVPDTGTVRPTTDKMRQMLFNMLGHSKWARDADFSLNDCLMLDGFCGSGALGIEALSRGAAHAVFVDSDRKVMDIARENIETCKYKDRSLTLLKNVQSLGARPDNIQPRNLVLLDPPYRKDLIVPALTAMAEGGWLAESCLCVAESERGWQGVAPASFTPVHTRDEGDSQLNVWHYSAI